LNNQQAYNTRDDNYGTVKNKIKDIEAFALKEMLSQTDLSYAEVLEIGC